jgi:hypothetical protein
VLQLLIEVLVAPDEGRLPLLLFVLGDEGGHLVGLFGRERLVVELVLDRRGIELFLLGSAKRTKGLLLGSAKRTMGLLLGLNEGAILELLLSLERSDLRGLLVLRVLNGELAVFLEVAQRGLLFVLQGASGRDFGESTGSHPAKGRLGCVLGRARGAGRNGVEVVVEKGRGL